MIRQLYQPGQWKNGEYIRDRQQITIPADWAGRRAVVYMGLWNGPNRLRVIRGPNDGDNRARVATFTIEGGGAGAQPNTNAANTIPSLEAKRAEEHRARRQSRRGVVGRDAVDRVLRGHAFGRQRPVPRACEDALGRRALLRRLRGRRRLPEERVRRARRPPLGGGLRRDHGRPRWRPAELLRDAGLAAKRLVRHALRHASPAAAHRSRRLGFGASFRGERSPARSTTTTRTRATRSRSPSPGRRSMQARARPPSPTRATRGA